MTESKTTTTVKFEHRLNQDVPYDYYGGPNKIEKGHLMKTSTTDGKFNRYTFILGHGDNVRVEPEQIDVFKVTRKTTVEITKEKV